MCRFSSLDTFFHLFDEVVCLMKSARAAPLHALAPDDRSFRVIDINVKKAYMMMSEFIDHRIASISIWLIDRIGHGLNHGNRLGNRNRLRNILRNNLGRLRNRVRIIMLRLIRGYRWLWDLKFVFLSIWKSIFCGI